MGSFQTEIRGLDFSGILTTFSCVKLGNWGLVFLSSLRGLASPGLYLPSLFKNLSFAVATQILKAGWGFGRSFQPLRHRAFKQLSCQ